MPRGRVDLKQYTNFTRFTQNVPPLVAVVFVGEHENILPVLDIQSTSTF